MSVSCTQSYQPHHPMHRSGREAHCWPHYTYDGGYTPSYGSIWSQNYVPASQWPPMGAAQGPAQMPAQGPSKTRSAYSRQYFAPQTEFRPGNFDPRYMCYPVMPNYVPFQPLAPALQLDCYTPGTALHLAYAPRMMPAAMHAPQAPSPVVNVQPAPEYNVYSMADFTAIMAYDVMSRGRKVWQPAQVDEFRKFVLSLFKIMRLSKSTIILSLVYLSKGWSLPELPLVLQGESDLFYVGFVTSLVLANKIQDDNTFTNHSWSQATGISTAAITRAELGWLKLISWDLHAREGECQGWNKWHECWYVFSGRTQPVAPPSPQWALPGVAFTPGFSVPVSLTAC